MGYFLNGKLMCKVRALANREVKDWTIMIQNRDGDTDYRYLPFGVRLPKLSKNLSYGDMRHFPGKFPQNSR